MVLVRAEDEFGPISSEDGNNDAPSFGNSSGNNTNLTTTTTTTTTLPEMPHIHLAYFVSRVNQTDQDGNNPHLENLDCNLARVGQGAYFLNLEETGHEMIGHGACKAMPIVEGVEGVWYYNLAMTGRDPATGVNNITSFNAMCPDSTCNPDSCKISRVPEPSPSGIPGTYVSPLAYDTCQPTNGKELFSYFVREGHGANMVHDVCLLKNKKAEATFGITQLKFPPKSNCDAHEPGAIVASSLRSISGADDCDVNHFDGTSYQLRSIGQRIDGLIGCSASHPCEAEFCERYDGFWGQCSGHGTLDTKDSHFKIFETRANGMSVSDSVDPEKNKGIPLCSGMAPTPTPRVPNTPTPSSDPSKKGGESSFKMVAIILGSLMGAFVLAYSIFWVLRRRKLRRMSAYAALQDDPTF